MALENKSLNQLYLRVELPRIYKKHRVQFDLVQYTDHPLTGQKVEIGREIMECDYDLEGPNVFEQCYNFAKEQLPYDTIDC